MVDAKHYEVAKNVTLTHHGLSSVAWGISDSTWEKLSENQQEIVVACDRERVEMQRELQLEEIASIEEYLTEQGVEFAEIDTTELKEYAENEVYPSVVDTPEAQDLLDSVRGLAG
jgi:TRAP-type C4-dicarboxylate transport system substrate-binding protein